jgi:hypothetical protein
MLPRLKISIATPGVPITIRLSQEEFVPNPSLTSYRNCHSCTGKRNESDIGGSDSKGAGEYNEANL